MMQARVLDRQRYNPSLKTAFRGFNSFKRFFVFTASLFFAAAFAGFFGCDSSSDSSSGSGSSGGGGSTLGIPTATPVASSDFVKISAGKMKLAEDGSYEVTITRAYIICNHEVTQGEYETYCKYGGSDQPSDTYGKGDSFPVYYVNWYDAIVYCNLRSKAENLTPCYKLSGESNPTQWSGIVSEGASPNIKYCGPSGSNDAWNGITCDFNANGYRLPTAAEWEIAARGSVEGDVWAGTDTNANNELDDYAWYRGNSGNKTQEVKQKQPNGYGLYDMSGNVWEWCWDWFDSSAYTGTATDPTGPGSSPQTRRVERGGSWDDNAPDCRVAYLYNGLPLDRNFYLGFRVVRSGQ